MIFTAIKALKLLVSYLAITEKVKINEFTERQKNENISRG